jgi:glucose/arabinose dehydrogenase
MGHKTRTLIFDKKNYLYVSVGSVGNVDVDDYRSRIRRFLISPSTSISDGGFEFDTGEVFATGLRNEVGLAFDKYDVLYGVENGADNLNRQDLGGDIHNENPGEELNRFPVENLGKHYGYPFCWTEYLLPKTVGKGKGTIWAWPSTMATKNDQWCRDNTIKPVLSMQAHSAPLGITFFNYSNVGENSEICPDGGSFPKSMDGDAFIAFHGSWNRNPPTGYKVVRVPFGNDGNPTVDEPIDFLCHRDSSNNGAKWPDGFRPVDVVFDKCNRLLVTSDGTGGSKSGASVVLVSYNGGGGGGRTNTSPSPSSNDNGLNCKLCNDDGKPDLLVTIIVIAVASVVVCLSMIAAYILYKRRKKNKAGNNTSVEVHEKKSPLA